jgi:hypothetical protein
MQPFPVLPVSGTVDEAALTSEIAARLPGSSADGSQFSSASVSSVIWVEHGDEVLVHLDSVQVRLLPGSVLVSVDLETDQTGRATLVMAFALGNAGDPAGLTAVTDDLPRGLGTLAARWGKTLQLAVWASILGFAQDSAAQQGGAPVGLAVSQGSLTVVVGTPLSARSRGLS